MFVSADDDPLDDSEVEDESFDYRARCDELRRCETAWLRRRRRELVREQRRLRIEEYAVTLVLAERDALDDLAGDGVSERTSRDTVDTAKSLEHQPNLAGAAHDGDLSDEQLGPLSRLADESDEAEWAARGPNLSPADLRRMEQTRRKPTPEDGAARRNARDYAMWWRNDMLHLRGALPDVDGKLFESVMQDLIASMKPAKGRHWDTFAHRGADALVQLAGSYADGGAEAGDPASARTGRGTPHLIVQVPLEGPAEIVPGIPIDDATVEALRVRGLLELVLVDECGVPIVHGRATPAIPNKIRRAVLLRDGHRCRWPGCERTTGLDVHHMWPRSWGGTDDISNLLSLCKGGGTRHHQQNIPQGQWALVGNPNLPDGLRLVHRRHPDAPTPEARDGPAP